MRPATPTRLRTEQAYGQTGAVLDGRGLSFGVKVAIGIVVWGVMSLAAALHWFGTNVDYFNYVSFYNGVRYDLSVVDSRFEGGFVLLSWIYKYLLETDYDALALTVISASLAIKFYIFFKYLQSPLLAISVYLMIFYPLYEYTQIRAALASSLVYFAIHVFMERKYYLACALLLGALLFHVSAIIVAVAVAAFLCVRRPAGVVVALIGLFALAIWYEDVITTVTGALPLINPFSTRYLDNTTADLLPTVWSVQNIFLLSSILVLAFFNDKRATSYEYLFMFLSFVGFLMLVTFINSPVLAQRSKELLALSTIFLVFRGQIGSARNTAFILMFLGGVWSVYRAFSDGVLGG